MQRCALLLAIVLGTNGMSQERTLAEQFKALDRDKDGKVTKQEAGKAWARYERMDVNGDGAVTLEEIRAFETRGERPGGAPPSFRVETFKSTKGETIKYSWFAPKAFKDVKLPLVLCLHGAGGSTRAAEVLAMPKMQEKYPCFVMAPGCDKKEGWGNTEVLGRSREKERLPLVVEAIRERLANEPIDAKRVYVTGQSLGGVGTWAALARHGDLFAAGVPVCGAWDPKDVPVLAKTPLWAFHGVSDGAVPVKWSRELTSAITKAGGVAKYTEYADLGHGIWVRTYDTPELWDWLFKQRRE